MKYITTVLFSLFLSYSLQADIINVPSDHSTIQAGINAATDGDTVLVAAGTYLENINFRGKAITVGSHFIINGNMSHISATIIDGSQPSDPDSGSVVTFDSGEDTTSVLSGFTITGGTGTMASYTWQGNIFIERSGGGVHCYNAGAKIKNNVISNNHISQLVDTGGGGINVYTGDSGSFALIVNNKINTNSVTGLRLGWGAAIEFSGNGVVENNEIYANTANATEIAFGAISCWGDIDMGLGNVLIKNNHISQNIVTADSALAGGIELQVGMQAQITGNTISGNILNGNTYGAGGGIRVALTTTNNTISGNYLEDNEVHATFSYGGGIRVGSTQNNSTTIITNNIIVRNYARAGGGIRCANSFVRITNNTILANHALSNGGGIQIVGSPTIVSIINNILWHNTASSDAQVSAIANANIFYSNVQGITSGVGNISNDPRFADTTAYYLSDNSPCIDAGHPDPLYYDPEDPFNPGFALSPAMGTLHNDIGAYGGSGSKTIVGIEELPSSVGNLPADFQLSQNYPNPFNPSTTIEFTIAKAGWVTLKIYNVLGEAVTELVAAQLNAGNYRYNWNAEGLPSGVYFYRLEAKGISQTKKLLLLK